MTRMPDFEADIRRAQQLAASGIEHLIPHHRDQGAEPADDFAAREEAARHQLAQNARSFAEWFDPTPQEAQPMSRLAEAKQIFHDGLTRLEGLDEDALTALEAVQAHPDAYAAFRTLASLAGVNVPPGALTTAIDVLRMTLATYVPPETPSQPEPAMATDGQPPVPGSTDPRQFG